MLVAPVHDSEGRIRKLVATARDITEAKEAEEQIKLLMHEVNHRSKNLFAVVQAVTRQMGSGEEARAFAARLSERLAALAQSYDLLVKSEWRGVNIADLVHSQLGHFKDLIGTPRVPRRPARATDARRGAIARHGAARAGDECQQIRGALQRGRQGPRRLGGGPVRRETVFQNEMGGGRRPAGEKAAARAVSAAPCL